MPRLDFNKSTLVATIKYLISESKYSSDMSMNDRMSIAKTLFYPRDLGYNLVDSEEYEQYVAEIIDPVFVDLVGGYVSSSDKIDDSLSTSLGCRGKSIIDDPLGHL